MELDSVLVIIPMAHELNRGVHAGSHSSSSRVVIRTNLQIRTLIQTWAGHLQISEAEFMRAASYNMAKALEKRSKEKDNDHHSNRS